ncbi:MAG TPA: hypothetical protein VMA75_01445 [Candidatus Paceibacterota bacterium]|nr:hypothetical protein [Candidatus Paceibacterota bacterium]
MLLDSSFDATKPVFDENTMRIRRIIEQERHIYLDPPSPTPAKRITKGLFHWHCGRPMWKVVVIKNECPEIGYGYLRPSYVCTMCDHYTGPRGR